MYVAKLTPVFIINFCPVQDLKLSCLSHSFNFFLLSNDLVRSQTERGFFMAIEKLNFVGYHCQATEILVKNSDGMWEEFSSLISLE